MAEDNFLQSVARYYAEGGAGRPAHHNVVYVTPNKRSAVFLKRYVTRLMTRTGRLPRLMTLRSLTDRMAGRPQAPHIRLIFMLYDAYRTVMTARGRRKAIREFDSFVFWGDMMLADFDEIDRSLVDAEKLFKNLRDVKDIQSDYLEPEVKELVHRVFGESRLTADYGEDSFWLHLADAGAPEGLKGRFVFLWQILGDIYKAFHTSLAAAECSSEGSALRSAAAVSADEIFYTDDPDAHYVFVGFNDLCAAELAVFHSVRRRGRASFFWDIPAGYVASGADSDAAVARLRKLAREFPMPDDYDYPGADTLIQAPVEVYAVPSNVGQAKFAGSILEKWITEGKIIDPSAMNTAVVVPDAGLLLPLMFSLPEWFDKINVSTGLPFRATNFAGFLQAIVSMQLRSRRLRGKLHFFYEDVAAVLNHPYMRAIDNAAAEAVLDRIADKKLYNIDADEITEFSAGLANVFRSTGGGSGTVAQTRDYLLGLIDWLSAGITAVAHADAAPGARHQEIFEARLLENFRRQTNAIADCASDLGISFTDRTFLMMFQRVLSRETIPVEGNPLYGLQVLGVLETRALDFDNVIILSMNEGTYPRRQYSRTMIPASLRAAYELPDLDSLEATYAYCFFRLLSRAKNIALLYDSRVVGLGGGEMSRYISRLQYLSEGVEVRRINVAMNGSSPSKREICVSKTPEVIRHLDKFRRGEAFLSATALKEYKKCPLAFYLKYVHGMRGNDEMVDYLTAAEQGTLIHESIQRLFESLRGKTITAPMLAAFLDPDNTAVEDTVLDVLLDENGRYQSYRDDRSRLPKEAVFAWKTYSDLVRADLRAEAAAYCADGAGFSFLHNEMNVRKPWKVSENLTVYWTMSIDRVDRTCDGRLRFIDFKSGTDEIAAPNYDTLFSADYRTNGMFQLLAYCQTYLDIENADAKIVPYIHRSARLLADPTIEPLKIGGSPIGCYDDAVAAEFGPKLRALVEEIFDPAEPFNQPASDKECTFCKFKQMCGRMPASDF